MGYNIASWHFVNTIMEDCDKIPSRICLLGNLYFHRGMAQMRNTYGHVAQKYYEKKGYDVISIDINGKDGALPYNLEKPLPKSLGQFDAIVNGGTTEHIRKQHECFENIHNICKIDGLMFHLVPHIGSWPTHAYYTYTERFFLHMAAGSGYTIVDMFVDDYVTKRLRRPCDLLFVCMRKEYDKSFGGVILEMLQRT